MRTVLFILITIGLCACNEYTPKPKGYNRIESESRIFEAYTSSFFSFEYNKLAHIDTIKENTPSEFWFNIVYPKYNAKIYCSFITISKNNLNDFLTDSYRLAYSHSLMADAINQTVYSNKEHQTFGIIYDIHGNVATPIQAYVTDSTSNFLRLSLYYDSKVSTDSVAPITEYLRSDIIKLIESLQWK